MIVLSLIAIVYIGFVALAQSDMKRLIAYSSIAHMGFVTLGLFVALLMPLSGSGFGFNASQMAIEGAMVQMISHGLISGALFLCVGVLYDRLHTRDISDFGGVANVMPVFAALTVLFAMANAGLPGTSGFVGEFLVILASFKHNMIVAALAATTLVIGAAYTLWMVKRVFYGEVSRDGVAALKQQPLQFHEWSVLGVLALLVVLVGVWPQPILDTMASSIAQLLEHLSVSKVPF
ncbi:MAG: NADH-quinone oxidoreductase subunit M, partial [Gammaproteobacteria bacterium]|nr:NADH-quinone oxidoreductase subunit M [Gammaproteobacteria bacterium]